MNKKTKWGQSSYFRRFNIRGLMVTTSEIKSTIFFFNHIDHPCKSFKAWTKSVELCIMQIHYLTKTIINA